MKKRVLEGVVFFALAAGTLCVLLLSTRAGSCEEEEREAVRKKEVSLEEVPAEVRSIILEELGDHELAAIEEISHGDWKLYEAEWLEGEMEHGIQIAYACKLVGRSMEIADEGEEEEQGEEEEEEEEGREKEISFNQLPAPVLRAIAKLAGKHRLEEIEQTISEWGTAYQTCWREEGWETEILVDPEGKLLRRQSRMSDEEEGSEEEEDGAEEDRGNGEEDEGDDD